ncbi:MAG: RNA 2',3'-cyclic phosphodiesterase [Syntrophobacteraceae bacterium]|nr:RNA 2',3'-cyclic phosphodiesterase [Syntrophobacteraceae bacterium]
MIRSFVALDIPPRTREALSALTGELRKTRAPVGWVQADRVHLTLKFLGSVSPEGMDAVQSALLTVASASPPFRLQPFGCGAFPTIKQMRVVWVGLRGEEKALISLQNAVETALAPLGFEPEDRPFRAHLTLGRVKGRQHLRALQDALLARQAFEAEAFDVTELVLYRSDLMPQGALYTPLFRASFRSP